MGATNDFLLLFAYWGTPPSGPRTLDPGVHILRIFQILYGQDYIMDHTVHIQVNIPESTSPPLPNSGGFDVKWLSLAIIVIDKLKNINSGCPR